MSDDFDSYVVGQQLACQNQMDLRDAITNYNKIKNIISLLSDNTENEIISEIPPDAFFSVYVDACCPYGQHSVGQITITQEHINNSDSGQFHIYSSSIGAHQIFFGSVYKNGIELESDAWPCPFIGDGIELHAFLNVGDVIKFEIFSDCTLDDGCLCSENGRAYLKLSYYKY